MALRLIAREVKGRIDADFYSLFNGGMPSAEKEIVTVEPWGAGIALATLVLVGCVAVFTAWDRMHNRETETVVTPTAVGDAHYVQEPAGGTGPTGLKYQGENLVMISEGKMRDSKLIRAGTDDSGVYVLYRPEDEKEPLPKGHFYMKAKPNIFIVVSAE